MSDINVMLREQLDVLVPAYGPPDWDAVLARAGASGRRPHQRPLRLIAVALITLIGIATAANAAFGWKVSPFWQWVNSYPPGRTSPEVTVFSGSDWNLVAWMSTKGICMSYGAPGAAGNGCEGTHPAVLNDWGGGRGPRRSFDYGTVSSDVARLTLRLHNGQATRVALRAEPLLHTTRRFFYTSYPSSPCTGVLRRCTSGTLIAYDSQGRIIAHRAV
jgi:hypothetical protein